MKLLIVIPARGGSKGIPRKNLRSMNGVPLIVRSIENAKKISAEKTIVVSTDDEEISHLAETQGVLVIMRGDDLSGDMVTLDPVIFHALSEAEKIGGVFDLVVTMQPTSPLLKAESVDAAVKQMMDDRSLDTVISAREDSHLSWRKKGGIFEPNYISRLNRQELPPEYRETGGFVISRRNNLMEGWRIGGNISLHLLSHEECIDIDDFADWNICEYFLRKKHILFIVGGNSIIGLGHVYNSLIVANEILDHDVSFLVPENSRMAYEKIATYNYPVTVQKCNDILTDIAEAAPDVVIHDNLDTEENFICMLKEIAGTVITFEDLGSGASHADLVINAIYPESDVRPNHYFGQQYYCVRDEFLHYPEKKFNPTVKRILVTFGGVDPADLTRKTLKALESFCRSNDIAVDVVVGFGYEYADLIAENKTITVHRDIKNISKFMYDADIAITSAGRTIYELATIGTPSVVLCQNPREMTHFFASSRYGFINLGLGSDVKEKKITDSINDLANNPELRQHMMKLMMENDLAGGKARIGRLIRSAITAGDK